MDVAFSMVSDPLGVASKLESIPGVLGHGLFLSIAHEALIGGPEGVQHLHVGTSSDKT